MKKVRKVTTADGTIMYVWDGKLHNWEGPAWIPEGNKKKAKYYINGFEYTKDQWKDRKRDLESGGKSNNDSKHKI